MQHTTTPRSRAAKSLAALLAGFVLAFSLPLTALAQAASEPAAAAAPAPTPAPAAAPAATPAVTTEAVDNPYGLKALWTQGDFVAHATLIIMAIMSMGSWYVIFTKLFEQRQMMKSAKESAETFWKANSVKAGVGTLTEGSAFHFIANRASRPATTTRARWSRPSTSTPGSACPSTAPWAACRAA